MAKANPVNLQPQAPVLPEGGPEIVYEGEGAEAVKFVINPRARKYVVKANGVILETF